MKRLTEKDYQILDYIYEQLNENGFPPTVREICEAVHLNSPATVHARLKKLEEMDIIEKQSTKNRGMRLINYTPRGIVNEPLESDEHINIPVYGKITAGQPITAVENLERHFPLPMDFAHNKDIFMLRVSGESMINAAILDNDYIIVEKQNTASNGDIVVALINGSDATVKTFYKEDGHFRLQPENDFMDPIIVDEVEILGKVVGVYRKF